MCRCLTSSLWLLFKALLLRSQHTSVHWEINQNRMEGAEGGRGVIDVRGEERNMGVSLKELSKKLEEFAKARGWEQYHSPRNLLLAMVGEVGELSVIFQWRGEVVRGLPNWADSDKEHLGEELSDVLLYLVRLADICGIDLGEAATRKIVKNAIKYPA